MSTKYTAVIACDVRAYATVELQADTWEQARAQAVAIVNDLKDGVLDTSDVVFDPEWDTMDNFTLLDSEPREREAAAHFAQLLAKE